MKCIEVTGLDHALWWRYI